MVVGTNRRYAKQFARNGGTNGPAKREVEGEYREIDESLPAVRNSSSWPGEENKPVALVPLDPEGKPWDRLRGETMRWYSRFEAYRSMGPTRSIGQAYKIWHANEVAAGSVALKSTNPVPSGVPQSVWRLSMQWRWSERAEAWDSYQIDQNRLREVERIAAANADRVNTGKTLRNLGVRAVTGMDPRTIKPLEAVALVKTGDEMIAKGLGLDLKENQEKSDTIHVKVLDLSSDDDFEMPPSHAMLGPGDNPDPDNEEP